MINPKTSAEAEEIALEEALNRTRKKVEQALTRTPKIIREYTDYLSESTGKFIRAKSMLTCALKENGRVDAEACNLAAAIEIIHLASLVHDDVIDNAALRRGKPSLQKKFGVRTAVICGDYLLSVALNLVASVADPDRIPREAYPNYIEKLCLGELQQHLHNADYTLNINQYLRIIQGKTAALFDASFLIGAHLAGELDQVAQYKKIGRYVGMVFQLTDDCMDYESSEHKAKKPVRSDYEQGVVTLPLIVAIRDDEAFRNRLDDQTLDEVEIKSEV